MVILTKLNITTIKNKIIRNLNKKTTKINICTTIKPVKLNPR